jgi:ABC-type uncharacterized transport system substrate-binding protein
MKSTTIGFARKILLYSVSFQCTCLLVFGAVAESQPAKLYRVGVLVVGGADIPQINGLRDGLKAYGYIQGRNLDLEIAARETYDEYRPLVKSYKEKNVDVLVTIGGTATGVVKDIAPEIPTVFSFGSDPVQAGFIKSIARPESNLTGVPCARVPSSKANAWKSSRKPCQPLGESLCFTTPGVKIPVTKWT